VVGEADDDGVVVLAKLRQCAQFLVCFDPISSVVNHLPPNGSGVRVPVATVERPGSNRQAHPLTS
jgi:hypothetical protein